MSLMRCAKPLLARAVIGHTLGDGFPVLVEVEIVMKSPAGPNFLP
jgi:hypothetical protein